jgi:hypothetical protein
MKIAFKNFAALFYTSWHPKSRKRRGDKGGVQRETALYTILEELKGQERYLAADVIKAFGNVENLIDWLKHCGKTIDRMSVYRWQYPKPHGTGGGVPPKSMKWVLLAAKRAKIDLSRCRKIETIHKSRGRRHDT